MRLDADKIHDGNGEYQETDEKRDSDEYMFLDLEG